MSRVYFATGKEQRIRVFENENEARRYALETVREINQGYPLHPEQDPAEVCWGELLVREVAAEIPDAASECGSTYVLQLKSDPESTAEIIQDVQAQVQLFRPESGDLMLCKIPQRYMTTALREGLENASAKFDSLMFLVVPSDFEVEKLGIKDSLALAQRLLEHAERGEQEARAKAEAEAPIPNTLRCIRCGYLIDKAGPCLEHSPFWKAPS